VSDAFKLQVKLFVTGGAAKLQLEPFIPVFHDWIKHHKLGDELLIDVANYAHVPQGPGVALIGHAGDYFIDEAEGRPGLLYSRKRDPLPPGERVPDAFKKALRAAHLLEADSPLRFRTDEFLFRINDRLAAPSGEKTFAELRPALDAVCARLFGNYKLALAGTPRELFSVRITTDSKLGLESLLSKLG
jgi:hypothetical protein